MQKNTLILIVFFAFLYTFRTVSAIAATYPEEADLCASVMSVAPKNADGSAKNREARLVAQKAPEPKAIKQDLPKPTPSAPAATPQPTPAPADPQTAVYEAPAATGFDHLFEKYAAEYGVKSSTLSIISKCESGHNPQALSSNQLYGGLFQFSAPTWQSNRRAMGLDDNPSLRFNAEEAVKTAAFKISRDGVGAWPTCGKKAL